MFLRYLKPSGENNLESPDYGTNTSSSGRGEDEGETSGATSGEDVWGTPTSGGDYEEELVGESSTLSVSVCGTKVNESVTDTTFLIFYFDS